VMTMILVMTLLSTSTRLSASADLCLFHRWTPPPHRPARCRMPRRSALARLPAADFC
jgi:hypothetical protein